MSEVTTGSVGLGLIVGAPVVIGAACVAAVGYAAMYCKGKYDDMLKEIQSTDDRLKWLNTQQYSSPLEIAREAKKLQEIVFRNELFSQMTTGMTIGEKNTLATAIATENSPLKSYIPKYLNEMSTGNTSLNDVVVKSSKDLAIGNFNHVNNIIKNAAQATGFSSNIQVIKNSKNILDIVFTDSEGRKFTAYTKINKELNPSIALDLEGFECDTNGCSLKMDEIIKYLNEHGIPFKYKRLKHNQPSGILRKILNKKSRTNKTDGGDLSNYLSGENSNNNLKNKQ
jgi:hypothetical protein